MFHGIHDKLRCLDRPVPQRGSNYPPPLTYCINKVIFHLRSGGIPYTNSMQPAWQFRPFLLRSLPTSAHPAPPVRNRQRYFAMDSAEHHPSPHRAAHALHQIEPRKFFYILNPKPEDFDNA